MMKKYNIDGTKIKGKKALVGWVGENKNYEKLRQYVLDNYTDLASVSSYLGALANCLIAIDKYKFRKIAGDLHIGAKNAKSIDDAEGNDGMLKPHDRENWLHYLDLVGIREAMKIRRYANRTDKQLNIDYLILCLNTMMPPTRLDYCTAKFFPTVMNTVSDQRWRRII